VAEEGNAAVLELRTLLLESESESIVGGNEMVYSHRRRQRRAKTDSFCPLRALTIPLLASMPTLVVALEGPPSVTGTTVRKYPGYQVTPRCNRSGQKLRLRQQERDYRLATHIIPYRRRMGIGST
jgi:hypothetical protein